MPPSFEDLVLSHSQRYPSFSDVSIGGASQVPSSQPKVGEVRWAESVDGSAVGGAGRGQSAVGGGHKGGGGGNVSYAASVASHPPFPPRHGGGTMGRSGMRQACVMARRCGLFSSMPGVSWKCLQGTVDPSTHLPVHKIGRRTL